MKTKSKKQSEFRRSRQLVDPFHDLNDMRVFTIGVTGILYAKAIARRLDYSPGQVSYRLRKYGISLRDIRNNVGTYAHFTNIILREAERSITRQATLELRQHFKRLEKK